MKNLLLFCLILIFSTGNLFAQSIAKKRAETLDAGMNLSYLDNWWNGSKEKHYSDFAKPEEAAERETKFAGIAKAGFKTVRIPICFSAWMELKQPYNWDNPKALEMADSFVKWGLANDLNVIIDLHHSEFDRSVEGADNPERLVNLWVRIAERYKNTDPEKVFFELRNEPNQMTPEAWRWQAEQLIKYVREIAPSHTLIVGFTEWNGRKQLIESKPFADPNIIYTFHYYDPFLFTHQGAVWAGVGGIEELRFLPFPGTKETKIKTPKKARGQWTESLIRTYNKDSEAEKMFKDLKAASDWSVKNGVPIFLGEFGSYGQYAKPEDRCRYSQTVYKALGKLKIPNAWWEWDGGFNMFSAGTNTISECMREALDTYQDVGSDK